LVGRLGFYASGRKRLEEFTLVSKGIKNVLNVVKELSGSTSEHKISELESFIGSSSPE